MAAPVIGAGNSHKGLKPPALLNTNGGRTAQQTPAPAFIAAPSSIIGAAVPLSPVQMSVKERLSGPIFWLKPWGVLTSPLIPFSVDSMTQPAFRSTSIVSLVKVTASKVFGAISTLPRGATMMAAPTDSGVCNWDPEKIVAPVGVL